MSFDHPGIDTWASVDVPLSTGVTLHCVDQGQGEPLIFLHGFPETHRTWRHQLPVLARSHRVIAPDQRGYGRSSKPRGLSAYARDVLMADVMALADALGLDRFTLIGHDWGGGLGWGLAMAHPKRVSRLVILNAPHPWLFQRSLIQNADQRAASQYMRDLRRPGFHADVKALGLASFFESRFLDRVATAHLHPQDKALYLSEWGHEDALETMLNWYGASAAVVPALDEPASLPAWALNPPRPVEVPTLVLWGMADRSLMPMQLEGLEDLVSDLRIVRLDGVDHFVPWEAPERVNAEIRQFLEEVPV